MPKSRLELEGASATDSDAAFRSIAGSFGSEGSDAAARILAAHDVKSPGPQAEQGLLETIALAMKVSERAARLT